MSPNFYIIICCKMSNLVRFWSILYMVLRMAETICQGCRAVGEVTACIHRALWVFLCLSYYLPTKAAIFVTSLKLTDNDAYFNVMIDR